MCGRVRVFGNGRNSGKYTRVRGFLWFARKPPQNPPDGTCVSVYRFFETTLRSSSCGYRVRRCRRADRCAHAVHTFWIVRNIRLLRFPVVDPNSRAAFPDARDTTLAAPCRVDSAGVRVQNETAKIRPGTMCARPVCTSTARRPFGPLASNTTSDAGREFFSLIRHHILLVAVRYRFVRHGRFVAYRLSFNCASV